MSSGERKQWSEDVARPPAGAVAAATSAGGPDAGTCRLLLVRHATAEGTGRFVGHQDVPLSKCGREELELICEKCLRHPVRAIYSSDLRRAR